MHNRTNNHIYEFCTNPNSMKDGEMEMEMARWRWRWRGKLFIYFVLNQFQKYIYHFCGCISITYYYCGNLADVSVGTSAAQRHSKQPCGEFAKLMWRLREFVWKFNFLRCTTNKWMYKRANRRIESRKKKEEKGGRRGERERETSEAR